MKQGDLYRGYISGHEKGVQKGVKKVMHDVDANFAHKLPEGFERKWHVQKCTQKHTNFRYIFT